MRNDEGRTSDTGTGAMTQREKDRRLIAEAGPFWDTLPAKDDWQARVFNPNTADTHYADDCVAAAARELNRIAREVKRERQTKAWTVNKRTGRIKEVAR